MKIRAVVTALLMTAWAVTASAAEPGPRVYVILWFDTEDYILPASDDAALRIADFLTSEGIRGTFKVVGEKARTLERRGRSDVIAALKKHEIGYHSNWHSVQPSPAMYCSNLGWDEGVAEFDRRERPGFDDVTRIFGRAPSCYGQPGSSWSPQSFGALRKWGVPVYLDAGRHVSLKGKPHYYGGLLTLYQLDHLLRADIKRGPEALKTAEDRFAAARKSLLAEGGGIVSTIYHPCEFIHKEFWDGVNFRHGANPPRDQWKLPPMKSPEEIRNAFEMFENYVRYMKRLPDVRFITASEAAEFYRDQARGRQFSAEELKTIAAAVRPDVSFQTTGEVALSPSEVFTLLNDALLARIGQGDKTAITLAGTPDGPADPALPFADAVTTDWSQFTRTAADVRDFLHRQGRIPSTVWLGSTGVPPEVYLVSVAAVVRDLLDGKPVPA
ncbi:MAG TPA: hypothetical protein VH120_15170, partial [Gemmataceae bacterium]|nr:hypothetical protein [Gemmataceae bacterium]